MLALGRLDGLTTACRPRALLYSYVRKEPCFLADEGRNPVCPDLLLFEIEGVARRTLGGRAGGLQTRGAAMNQGFKRLRRFPIALA